MTTQEVANRLVELCRQGKNVDAINELYADNIVSVEPAGSMAPHTEGKEAVLAKTVQWGEMVEELHGAEISDAIVSDNYFALRMFMDVTMKGVGRVPMDEIAVYEVKDGKIVAEQFIYTVAMQPANN